MKLKNWLFTTFIGLAMLSFAVSVVPQVTSFKVFDDGAFISRLVELNCTDDLTCTENLATGKIDMSVIAPSAAPTTAQYVTLALDATLSAERVLTGTANQVILADGGANTTITLSTPQDIATSSSPTFANLDLDNRLNHSGDADTFIDFNTDEIEIEVGSIFFVRMTEAATDVFTINPNAGDVNFIVETLNVADALTLDAGADTAAFNVPLTVNAILFETDSTFDIGTVTVRASHIFTDDITIGGASLGLSDTGLAADVFLKRDAADILAMRNSTTDQSFHIYRTFTDASNYERLEILTSGTFSAPTIRTAQAGTGSSRTLNLETTGTGSIFFQTNSTTRWAINGSTGDLGVGADSTFDIGNTTARPAEVFVDDLIAQQVGLSFFGSAADIFLQRSFAGGLSIDQDAFDVVILALRSTDIAHSCTTCSVGTLDLKTGDYFGMGKRFADAGGIEMIAIAETAANHSYQVYAIAGSPLTGDTSFGTANWHVIRHDGADARVDFAANSNAFSWRQVNAAGTVTSAMVLKVDGRVFSGGLMPFADSTSDIGTSILRHSTIWADDVKSRQVSTANVADTLGAAATVIALTSDVETITGDAGTNTIATITGGEDGSVIKLIFTDALVTITDDGTHTSNTVDLDSAFTSADNVVLTLVRDGTSWYEVARSAVPAAGIGGSGTTGTLPVWTSSSALGDSIVSESGTVLTVANSISIATQVTHTGDTDTHVAFVPDTINLTAGGLLFADLVEDTVSEYTINPNQSDIDFVINTGPSTFAFFVDAGTDLVGTNVDSRWGNTSSDEIQIIAQITSDLDFQATGTREITRLTAANDTNAAMFIFQGGTGGTSVAATGGTGSSTRFLGGVGGAGSAGFASGIGGSITIQAGDAGADGGGGSNFGGAVLIAGGNGTVDGNIQLGDVSTGTIIFGTGGTSTRWTMQSNGDLVPGTANTLDIGSTSAGIDDIFVRDRIERAGDSDTFIDFNGDTIDFDVGGLELLSLDHSGIDPAGVIFNTSQDIDMDLRWASDNVGDAFFLDAGAETAAFNVPLTTNNIFFETDSTFDIGTVTVRASHIYTDDITITGASFGLSADAAVADVFLKRDAANILAQRNSTTAQTFNLYRTFTDVSNYERLNITGTADFTIETEQAGTGTARNLVLGTTGATSVQFKTNNTTRWIMNSSGNIFPNTTATLDIGTTGNYLDDIFVGDHIEHGGDPDTLIDFNTNEIDFFAGAAGEVMQINATGVRINQGSGAVSDFRVNGDTVADALFVDVSLDRVTINATQFVVNDQMFFGNGTGDLIEFGGSVNSNLTWAATSSRSITRLAAAAETSASTFSLLGGPGGASVGTGNGGTGGALNISAGIGGAGDATFLPGVGGLLTISGGSAGADGGAGGSAGNNVNIQGGAGTGAGADGSVNLGSTQTTTIRFGTGGTLTRWEVQSDGDLVPGADATYDLGATSRSVSLAFIDRILTGHDVESGSGVGDIVMVNNTGSLMGTNNAGSGAILIAQINTSDEVLLAAGGDNMRVSAGTTFFDNSVDLGSSAADSISMNGDVDTNITLNTNDSFDIGTSSVALRTLYVQTSIIVEDNTRIGHNTVDGADNQQLNIGAGGAGSNARGAFLTMFGNEDTGTGKMQLQAGNVTGGDIEFYTGATLRWALDDTTGHIIPQADATYDIGTSSLGVRDIYITGSITEANSAGAGINIDFLLIDFDVGTADILDLSAFTGVIVNEQGDSAFDFRVETNNETNAFFIDAGAETGEFRVPQGHANTAVALGAAAVTFSADTNFVTVTGDGGANTIATITSGTVGEKLTLLFVDGLVTVTDDNTHAADSVDLSAAFTSADDTTLELIYDGTSWYEVGRSVN